MPKDVPFKPVGQRIVAVRERHHLKRPGFAQAIGMPTVATSLPRYESGEREPPSDLLKAIVAVYGGTHRVDRIRSDGLQPVSAPADPPPPRPSGVRTSVRRVRYSDALTQLHHARPALRRGARIPLNPLVISPVDAQARDQVADRRVDALVVHAPGGARGGPGYGSRASSATSHASRTVAPAPCG